MKTILKLISGLAVIAALLHPARAAGDQKFEITTLSSRPDMISGGDVLVQIDVPGDISLEKPTIKLNGQDVTSALHAGATAHALVGLVTGLKLGENTLEVFNGPGGKPVAHASLKNYPITGPIFSGTQEHPFICQTQDFKLPDKTSLGAPLDANCSVKTIVSYVYKSTESASPLAQGARGGAGIAILNLKPLPNMTALPADVAYTTTTTGQKVPFVVRVETGTINRGIYQIAILTDPIKQPQLGPFDPPKEWNRRLLYSFGPGCPGGWLKQGASIGFGIGPGGLISDEVVGKGYAEASSTLNVFGNNCNDVIAAETMMMVRERFIKAYGKPEFTFSRGASGGSEQQIPIAENYPGLLDGIIPSMTFTDVLSNAQGTFDNQLLHNYYLKVGAALTDDQKLAIAGIGALRDYTMDNSRIDPRGISLSLVLEQNLKVLDIHYF